ncbi:MAG: PTS sugar transporter subunit IIA, partial [Candidatus Omnitrophica bacterium]|nr:PTS sugar transporter subunit IIA [Candidatus Omnitrophota bacterium]
MAVSEYIKEKNCIMNLESSDKDGSIKEIANKLSGQGKIKNKEKFIKDVLEREFLGSTGIGNNVAIP